MKDLRETEKAVLGAIMLENTLLEVINSDKRIAILGNKAYRIFSDPFHRETFKVIQKLYEKHEPISALSIVENHTDELAPIKMGQIAELEMYIMDISESSFMFHLNKLFEAAFMRGVIAYCDDLKSKIADDVNIKDAIGEHVQNLHKLADMTINSNPDFDDLVYALIDRLSQKGKIAEMRYPCSLPSLNRALYGGFKPMSYSIEALRQTCKTALAVNIMLSISYYQQKNDDTSQNIFFSLDDHPDDILVNMIACAGGIDRKIMQQPKIAESEIAEIIEITRNKIMGLPIILKTGTFTGKQIISSINSEKRKHKLGLVVIDCLQMLNKQGRPEYVVYSEFIHEIKQHQQENGYTLLLLTHQKDLDDSKGDKAAAKEKGKAKSRNRGAKDLIDVFDVCLAAYNHNSQNVIAAGNKYISDIDLVITKNKVSGMIGEINLRFDSQKYYFMEV